MNIAAVGYSGNSGVARELIDAVRHLPIKAIYISWWPNITQKTDCFGGCPFYVEKNGSDILEQMESFIREHKIDSVLTWETSTHEEFPGLWEKMGIRWMIKINWELFYPQYLDIYKKASLLISPNSVCREGLLERYGLPSVELPAPVDTDFFGFRERTKAERFVSIYGRGMWNRRSIPEIIKAWRSLEKPAPSLSIMAQEPHEGLIKETVCEGVSVEYRDFDDPNDLYERWDAAVQVSRYEGTGLTMLEAQSKGLPVITTDALPMRNTVPPSCRVPVSRCDKVMVAQEVDSFVPSVEGIASRVEMLRKADVREFSREARKWVEDRFSWKILRDQWIDAITRK